MINDTMIEDELPFHTYSRIRVFEKAEISLLTF